MISNLKRLLQKSVVDIETGIDVYLFGSATISSSPRDIDIIIIYDISSISISSAIELRCKLRTAVKHATGRPPDILLLNVDEATESRFLLDVRALMLIETVNKSYPGSSRNLIDSHCFVPVGIGVNTL